MSTWLLFVFITSSGLSSITSVNSIEFTNKESCEKVSVELRAYWNDGSNYDKMKTLCISKED